MSNIMTTICNITAIVNKLYTKTTSESNTEVVQAGTMLAYISIRINKGE